MGGNKLRILFILQKLCCNGAHGVALNLQLHLDRSRYEPTLLLLENKGKYLSRIPEDIKVVFAHKSLNYNRYLVPYYLVKIMAEARKNDVIVGAIEFRPTYLAYLAATLAGKQSVGWVHVPLEKAIFTRMARQYVRLLYPKLTSIVCVSNATKHSVLKVTPVKPERLKVIYSPYELDSIREKANEPVPDWAESIFKKPTLIGVGRMCHEKGFDILVEAHARVIRKGIDHNLLIIGPSNPFQNKLQELARDLRVVDSITIHGYVNNPYPLIKKASALVLSSRVEGLSNVVIEALALGRPIVATKCGGPDEILSDVKSAILVPIDDVDALASGMSTVLKEHRLGERFSSTSVELLQRFLPQNTMSKWEQLLTEISQQKAGAEQTIQTGRKQPGVAMGGCIWSDILHHVDNSFFRVWLGRFHNMIMSHTACELSEKELAGSTLVFAPHQDDETLGCGGTIIKKNRLGAKVTIVFLTDGRKSTNLIPASELGVLRQKELDLSIFYHEVFSFLRITFIDRYINGASLQNT